MHPDVVYQVIFLKHGRPLASPTVLGEFGRELSVEVPGTMRVLLSAQAPEADGRSFTSAKMSLYQDGAWQLVQDMSMRAYLSMTPSFQHSVENTPYRFVVQQRIVVHPLENEPGRFVVPPRSFVPPMSDDAP